MATGDIKIDVNVTELDVPMMIVVNNNGTVKLFEHGKEVPNCQRIEVIADTGSVPGLTVKRIALGDNND